MKRIKWAAGTGLLALSLVISGCAKKGTEAEKQLAETQKQLEEANKKLEGAGMKPVEGAPGAPAGSGGKEGEPPPVETGKPGWGDTKPAPAPAPAPPVTHTVAAGTPISVRTLEALSTKTAANGATFQATLDKGIEVDGYTVAPRGATVQGVVVSSDPGGKVKGVASITVALRRVVLANGSSLAISTGNHVTDAKSTKGKDAAKIGITSGIGAAIGAIAGGGKGAAIGAGAGAAGGTGLVLATKGAAAVIPSESLLTFKLAAPVSVTEPQK
jgi:hypothetical protein